jgi:hypothetical protein
MADIHVATHASTQRAGPSANWFSDLRFTWGGLVVKKNGRKITPKELTPTELAKFFAYLGVVLLQGARARLSGVRPIKVWFAPDRPRPWYVVWSAATLAGVSFAHNEQDADVRFYFEDVTQGAPPAGAMLNGGCADISKSFVAEVFGRVAGYPLALDPEAHRGVAVEKDEMNGAHDGRLVQCPAPRRPGRSYQHFIDSADGDTAYDYRTTIIDRAPQCVLVKTKPAADRFSIHNARVVYQPLEAVFTAAEVALLTAFAREMQLDWAALDVLRDRASGRIYVVDVNKTDTGPAVDLNWADRERLKARISTAFRRMLERA